MSVVLDSEKVYPKDYSPQLVYFEIFSFEEDKRVLNFNEAMEVSVQIGGTLSFHFKDGTIDEGEKEFTEKGYLQKKEKKENWKIILDDILADSEIGGKLQGEVRLGTFKVNFSYTSYT